MHKKTRSVAVPMITMLIIIIAVLSLSISFAGCSYLTRFAENEFRKSGTETLLMVLPCLDPDRFEEHLENVNVDDPDESYKRVQALLDDYYLASGCDALYVAQADRSGASYICIYDAADPENPGGRRKAGDELYNFNPDMASEIKKSEERAEKAAAFSGKSPDGRRIMTFASEVRDSSGASAGILVMEKSMDSQYLARSRYLAIICIISLVIAILSVFCFSYFIKKKLINPVREITEETRRFSGEENGNAGSLNAAEEIYETGELARTVLRMEDGISRYLSNLQKAVAEKERISTELSVATQIQAQMLPRIFPPFPERGEFDIYASMSPAKGVSGDFYDFCLLDDDHFAMLIADVSGKGIPAALFMVIARTLLKNRIQEGGSPAEILNDVNDKLCEGNDSHLFVTVWLAVLEISTGKGLAANAGHEHPALRRADGSFEMVKYRHTPAVATMEGMRFREHEFKLNEGDCLFVYTDGVTEASNEKDEMFGEKRLLEALNKEDFSTVRKLLGSVRSQIDTFVGEAMQFDDLTMLAFYYKGCPEEKKQREYRTEAVLDQLDEVLAFVDEQLDELSCPAKAKMQIDMAVEETFVNIASYAYGEDSGYVSVLMKTSKGGKTVTITFTDEGIPFDPLAKEDPDLTLDAEHRKAGGLGIFMVKKFMDNVSYEYTDGQNRLSFEKSFV